MRDKNSATENFPRTETCEKNANLRPGSAPADSSTEKGVRLQVVLAHGGIASRRACEELIAQGRVSVNGQVVTAPGTKVFSGDQVLFDGRLVTAEEKKRYILLNKPAGYVCTLSDEKGRETAADLLAPHFSERLYNVGRLDMYSCGLVLFTNDGEFAAAVSHPSSQIEKEYEVETSQPIPQELVERFSRGIRVEGVFYRCKEARLVNPRRLMVVLVEGKNREIRRVFEHFEVGIRRLTRVRIGSLTMDDLPEGEFRELTPTQAQSFFSLCK